MTFNKSQSSTEYIIITAMVLILVIGLLFALDVFPQIGALNSDRAKAIERNSFPIALESYALSSDGAVLLLKNTLPYPIIIQNVSINSTQCNSSKLPATFSSGQSLSIQCSQITVSEDEFYDFSVNITYQNIETATLFTQSDMTIFGEAVSSLELSCSVNTDCFGNDVCLYGSCYQGVVAYYNFENDGSDATWVQGKIGKALEFDGVNDYVLLDSDIALEDNFTAIFHYYGNDVSPQQQFFGNTGSDRLFINGAGIVHLRITSTLYTTSITLEDDMWYYGVLKRNGTDVTISFTLDNGTTFSELKTSVSTSDFSISQLGMRNSDNYLNGKLDDVVFYNRSLSDEEIDLLFDRANLGFANNIENERFAYYPFNSVRGLTAVDQENTYNGSLNGFVTTAYDSSNNGFNATYNGDVNLSYGLDNSYTTFDGNGDYISYPDIDEFDFGPNNFSISVWINNTISVDSETRGIVSKGGSTTGANEPFILFKSATGNIAVRVRNTSSSGPTKVFSYAADLNTNTNQWFHVVTTYEYGGNLTMYVDGIWRNAIDTEFHYPYNGSQPFSIGRLKPSVPSRVWQGGIDEVIVFNTTLSQEEVTQLYQNGPFR